MQQIEDANLEDHLGDLHALLTEDGAQLEEVALAPS